MNIGKAWAVFKQLKGSYFEIMESIKHVLEDPTINSITKDELRNAMRWMVDNHQQWIEVKYHEITDEERKEICISDDICYWLDCAMPDDEEEILIVRKWSGGYTTDYDTCLVDDGFYLDSGVDWREVIAWMPVPKYHFADTDKKVGGTE